MIIHKQNKVFSYALVVPQATRTPPPVDYTQQFSPYQRPQSTEESSSITKTTPTSCSRFLIFIGGIIIGIALGIAVAVPLMIVFYGSKSNGDSTTIISPTNIIPITMPGPGSSSSNSLSTATMSTSSSTTSGTSSTSSSSTTTTLTTTTNTVALSLSGVQINFDPLTLPTGWSICYNDTYDVYLNSSLLSTILSSCNKGKLLLGCCPVGNYLLTAAAMGLRADVLYNCSTITNCTHVANGVGWYYSDAYSWGFVNNTDAVSRATCDVLTTNSNYRLSWRTSSINGGFRCGAITNLNSATSYVRVIYHAN